MYKLDVVSNKMYVTTSNYISLHLKERKDLVLDHYFSRENKICPYALISCFKDYQILCIFFRIFPCPIFFHIQHFFPSFICFIWHFKYFLHGTPCHSDPLKTLHLLKYLCNFVWLSKMQKCKLKSIPKMQRNFQTAFKCTADLST